MSSPISDDLQSAIDEAYGRNDLRALEALIPRVTYEGPAARAALAEACSAFVSQIHMDVMCDKFPALDGLPEVIEGYAVCSRLCPEDAGYAIAEAEARLHLADEDPAAAAAETGQALAIADRLLAGWTAPDTGEPKFSIDGNLVTPRAAGREDVHALRAQALFALARLGPPDRAAATAAEACAAAEASISVQAFDRVLGTWHHGARHLAASDDPAVRAAGLAAQRAFDRFAARWIGAHPVDARWWGELFSRLADGGAAADGGPEALARAAAIWRDYAVDPSLSPRACTEIGHFIQRCGRGLGDRMLLRRALAFHEDALARSPDNFQSGYVAEVCTDLARLPGTPPDEQLAWYNRAVDACRRHEMPEDDFHFGVHFSELLLERAARFALPASHPDLEEAWRRSHRLIADHGDSYLVQSEHAAWARLLQRRDDEAFAILRDGLARIGSCVSVADLAERPWFQALGPERAAGLRRRLEAARA